MEILQELLIKKITIHGFNNALLGTVAKDTTYRNYYTGDANIEYDVYVDDANDCRVIEGYECELIGKIHWRWRAK